MRRRLVDVSGLAKRRTHTQIKHAGRLGVLSPAYGLVWGSREAIAIPEESYRSFTEDRYSSIAKWVKRTFGQALKVEPCTWRDDSISESERLKEPACSLAEYCNVFFRDCDECGKLFTHQLQGRKYCSKKCGYNDRRAKASNAPIAKTPVSICGICGNTFSPKHSRQKFCSMLCGQRGSALRAAPPPFQPRYKNVLVDVRWNISFTLLGQMRVNHVENPEPITYDGDLTIEIIDPHTDRPFVLASGAINKLQIVSSFEPIMPSALFQSAALAMISKAKEMSQ